MLKASLNEAGKWEQRGQKITEATDIHFITTGFWKRGWMSYYLGTTIENKNSNTSFCLLSEECE